MVTLRTSLVVLLGFLIVFGARGQFPSKCANIESLKNKICCPVPDNFDQPCGGPERGECTEISVPEWTASFPHYNILDVLDDRHMWPTLFYTKSCECKANFAGYDCSKCKFGYRGVDCTEKKEKLIRKDVRKMTALEKDNFMKVLNKSRHVTSDYKVAITFYKPLIEGNAADFIEVSVYDLYVWLHYYAARNTYLPHDTEREDIDFAHGGHGFPTWHRLFLLLWEAALQEVAGDDTFTIPYWDWTVAENCDICTEDFVGKSDEDGDVQGKYVNSKSWYSICLSAMIGLNNEQGKYRICNPRKLRELGLTRRPGTDRLFNLTTLPRKKEVDFALCFDTFDCKPYDKYSEMNFRNTLEGYANAKTGKPREDKRGMHNQVHLYLGGTLVDKSHQVTGKPGKYHEGGVMKDGLSSPNDPIFWLHHAFVDLIFEKWLRRHNKKASDSLTGTDAPIGHNAGFPIVPFIPVWYHEDIFRKSTELGYDYEAVYINGNITSSSNIIKQLLSKWS